MSQKLTYTIYSHADADGGIAAAIFARFILNNYKAWGWSVDVVPVNHGSAQGEWTLKEISWPCAILDFTLHPSLLSDRFFTKLGPTAEMLGGEHKVPQCYWLDHHPTGSSYPFLFPENCRAMMPYVVTKWDCSAISTPGLFRAHWQELGLPRELLERYEEVIDLAEIIDGALYATVESAHDFSSAAVKLHTLFSPGHPLVDRTAIYKKLVAQLIQNPSVDALFDSDPLYSAIVQWEYLQHSKQLALYRKTTQRRGKVAVSNFHGASHWEGMGRFVPYLLFPDVEYALHIMPKNKGYSALSCGINPWNKPPVAEKHLGSYFAKHFGGGGHAFVAGGKVAEADMQSVEKLIEYINQ